MSDKEQALINLCDTVHEIMQYATQDLPIPKQDQVRDARKKISVFTYGVISELAAESELDQDAIYARYLMMGGLSDEQANIIVKRTHDEFLIKEFAEPCLNSSKQVVAQWQTGNKNISSFVQQLL